MGASQSIETITSELISSPPKDKADPEIVSKALKDGNQTILEQDVRDKISKVSQVFTDFNTNDDAALMEHINNINKELKNNGQDEIVISEEMKKALISFRDAIVKNIDGTTIEKAEKYKEIMTKENASVEVIKILSDNIGKELNEKKAKFLENQPLASDSVIVKNVDTILDNVKGLKVKYKYFEYKYIEMNLFLIIFIQKVYGSMDSFVSNVLSFNMQRDIIREEMVRDTLNLMNTILDASDLQISDADNKALEDMMKRTKKRAEDKQKELNTYLENVATTNNNQLATLVNSFSKTLKTNLLAELNKSAEKKQQQGGQAFYEL